MCGLFRAHFMRATLHTLPHLPNADHAGSQFLVTELVQRGSLRGLLKSSLSLSFDQKLRMMRDAARGMAHLHGLRRVHRDLKTGPAPAESVMRATFL
jgi:serine/threonine protein kinase